MTRIGVILLIASLLVFAGDVSAFEPLFDARIDYGAGNGPWSVFAADIDGDGHNDLAVANWGSDNVSVLLNNGDGIFQAAVNYGVGYCPLSVVAVDLDGDGDNDLAVANYVSHNVSVLLNNGDGTFQAAVNYGAGGELYSVFAVDLDGDGDNDLAVASYWGNVSVLLNNGDGTFQAAVNYGAGNGPRSVFAVDLDGDGDNDLAVANSHSDNVSVLINLSITTGVDNSPETYLPGSYLLAHNYPNPFNASTTINYQLPIDSDVKLEVYNLLGQKVASLVDEKQRAGYRSVLWDASDVSSGLYFYKLTAGDYTETRRMMLVK